MIINRYGTNFIISAIVILRVAQDDLRVTSFPKITWYTVQNYFSGTSMFGQLLKEIEKGLSRDFKMHLKKASKVDFVTKDEKHGGTLIHWAAFYDKDNILQCIDAHLVALKLKSKEKIQIFCERDTVGRTPLHWCVENNALNSCEYLLTHYDMLGSLVDEKGISPLHLAAKENQLKMVSKFCLFDEKHNATQGLDRLIDVTTAKKELPIDLTTDAEIKLRLKTSKLYLHSLHSFFGFHLSTHRHYLMHSAVESSPLTQSELYPRSRKHPYVLELGDKAEVLYTDSSVSLMNGKKAHVGSYGNLLQMKGDSFKPKNCKPTHQKSDAQLYDGILRDKNDLCIMAIKLFKKQRPHSFMTVGHWNDYPSVMVFIPNESIHKAKETKKNSKAAFENWVNFILSYFVGLLNFNAYQKNLPIETERRGGFGFSLPTVAPTDASFRISMGMVPQDYVELLVDTLVILDDFLKKLSEDSLELPKTPDTVFYNSEAYKKYKGEKKSTTKLKDVVELLWAQVEKGGQTTVQNIMRSSYARDGIAEVVFTSCYKAKKIQPAEAFNAALLWAIKQIEVNKNSLTFRTKEDLEYPVSFKNVSYICEDARFWKRIEEMCERIKKLDDDVTDACLKAISECRISKNLQGLYYHLELLMEAIFVQSVSVATTKNYGDGYGSDSEEEGEILETPIFAKKVVTHSGMRAIWAAVCAVSSFLGDLRVFLQTAYYETPLGLKIIEQLNDLNTVTIVKDISKANVIIHDINACVTNGSNFGNALTLQKLKDAKRYIILDATSASSHQIHEHLSLLVEGRTRALLVAESGFKNQQLGSDKNPHGIVRIFSKEKKDCEALYKEIKKTEKPITSAESHSHRKTMKLFGATLSNKAILDEPKVKTLGR